MATDNPPKPAMGAASTRAQRILASLVAGASLDDIGALEKLSRRRTEKILRDELRRRWTVPSQEFAKLQIARLDKTMLKLIDRVEDGELEAIDRLLKVIDRLDRYHGFTRASGLPDSYGEEERGRLFDKLNAVVVRLALDADRLKEADAPKE